MLAVLITLLGWIGARMDANLLKLNDAVADLKLSVALGNLRLRQFDADVTQLKSDITAIQEKTEQNSGRLSQIESRAGRR